MNIAHVLVLTSLVSVGRVYAAGEASGYTIPAALSCDIAGERNPLTVPIKSNGYGLMDDDQTSEKAMIVSVGANPERLPSAIFKFNPESFAALSRTDVKEIPGVYFNFEKTPAQRRSVTCRIAPVSQVSAPKPCDPTYMCGGSPE